jgi:hypothetical protein
MFPPSVNKEIAPPLRVLLAFPLESEAEFKRPLAKVF